MNRIYLIFCLLLLQTFLIAQTDTIPPDINCPAADTVTLSAGGDCSFQYFYSIVSSDNEPGDTLVQLAGLESGAGFPLGNTVNVFQAIDAAGNTASCSFTLTVQNYAGPLVCKNDITVSLDLTCAWTAKASDLLDGNVGCTDSAYYVIEVDKTAPTGNGPWEPAEFGSGDVGKTYVFHVLDTIFGYNCTGTIQIKDQLPPVLTCQDITISCAVDNVAPYFLSDSLGFSAAQPVATDACSQVLLNHIDNTVDSGCTSGYVGAINRTWTAQDDSGNSSTCMQQILLTRPVISDLQYPPDITLDCANPDLSAPHTGLPYLEFAGHKWINTCSLGTAFNDTTLQLCPGISQVVRTWFVIDWCNGDALEKVQNITLNDATGPAFLNCPADVTVSAPTTNCLANVDLPDFIIADACSYATEINAYWVIDSIPGLLAGALTDFPGNDTT
ncbi:MAG TPA: HYR domain-containing protein, partial [Saprospiraceae bacterium]|nr:HYR domain-containing protein [Saprospiraceae bacterium]